MPIFTILIFFILPTYLLRFKVNTEISFNLLEIFLIISILNNFFILLKKYSLKKILSLLSTGKNIFLPAGLILIGFIVSFFYNEFSMNWIHWSDNLGKLIDLIILPIIFGTSLQLLSQLHSQNPVFPTFSQKSILLKIFFLFPLGLLGTIGYYFSTTLIAFLGIIYWLSHHLTFDNRLAIFFQSPNQLAIFISPALIIGLSFLFSQFNKSASHSFKRYWLLYLSLISLIINIFLTKSLGSWLALFLIIPLLISYYPIVKNKTIANLLVLFQKYFSSLVLLLIFASLFFIINTDLFLSHLNYHPTGHPSSYNSRLTIYQVDQKILATHWFWGIGINNFQNIYLQNQQYFPPYPQWAVPHAHNNLVTFWIEGGLLAGLGLLLIYLNILNPYLKQKTIPIKTSPKQKMAPRSSIVQFSMPQLTLIYFILHGLVDTTLWTPASATFFWFTLLYYLPKTELPKNH